MSEPRNATTALLLRAVEAVQGKERLEDALAALVDVLQGPLELWYVSLASVSEGGAQVTVLATWSIAETVFVPGTEVATSISPAVGQAMEVMQLGEPVVGLVTGDTDSILDHLLRAQGVVCTAAVPLQADGRFLILALGSSDPNTLTDLGTGFFRGLGVGIRERLCSLASLEEE